MYFSKALYEFIQEAKEVFQRQPTRQYMARIENGRMDYLVLKYDPCGTSSTGKSNLYQVFVASHLIFELLEHLFFAWGPLADPNNLPKPEPK